MGSSKVYFTIKFTFIENERVVILTNNSPSQIHMKQIKEPEIFNNRHFLLRLVKKKERKKEDIRAMERIKKLILADFGRHFFKISQRSKVFWIVLLL